MKNIFLTVFLAVLLAEGNAFAQDNTELFVEDLFTLAERFAQPASEGAAYQASAGWFSSAVSLEEWEVRFSLHGNALFIPNERKFFSLSNNELQLLEIEGARDASLPTAFGATTNIYFTGEVTYRHPLSGEMETATIRFKGFDGVDRGYIPHAFAQMAVGFPGQTELTLRATPKVTIDDVKASTFGIGLKHNLSQYFRGYNPNGLQLGIAGAYSKFNVEYEFMPIEIQDLVIMEMVKVDAHLFMFELIASRQWGVFELFGAAGAASSSFDYQMGGGGPALSAVNTQLEDLGDVQAYFKSDLGFNVHFGKFRISAMATAGRFFNANLGVHIRI